MLTASRARGVEAAGLVAAWLDKDIGTGEEERRTESRECSRGGARSRHGRKEGCCVYDDEERDGRYRPMSCAWYSYSVDEPGQLQDGRSKDGIQFVWSCDVFPAFAEAENGRNLSNIPIIRSL